MRRHLIITLVVISVAGAVTIPALTEPFADAGPTTTKIHFTRTISSIQDPAVGHEDSRFTMILSPANNTIYDGSLSYTASEPVQPVILHQISTADDLGQPIWTVDNNTIYAESVIGQSADAGTVEFTGAALALRGADDFTATISIDGWIRGKPIPLIDPTIQVTVEADNVLKLARASVPVDIPMHEGLYNESSVFYIITDSSDADYADMLTKKQKWRVEAAPLLAESPSSALEKIYIFENGIHGDGLMGYQLEIFSSTPVQVDEYSELREVIIVEWERGQIPVVLHSEEQILDARSSGVLTLQNDGVILNMPQIVWPEGELPQREDDITAVDAVYGTAQVTDISTENMTVTFVAHRGWGQDGQTIYYIVTGATPSGPAEGMGVVDVPKYSGLIANSAAVDLFQFQNGVKGTGPLGFQPGISTAVLGDDNYSPMWRIYLVKWVDPANATVLETIDDITTLKEQGQIEISIARPMNANHIVNCPFVDPFQ